MTVLTIWTFIKNNWRMLLAIVIAAFLVGWLQHQRSVDADAMAKLSASHQAEIDQINKARQDEQVQHQQELQQLQSTLTQLQQQYDAAQAQLAQQQQQEQGQIIKRYGNDAKGLADLAASKFGFVVVVPPSQ